MSVSELEVIVVFVEFLDAIVKVSTFFVFQLFSQLQWFPVRLVLVPVVELGEFFSEVCRSLVDTLKLSQNESFESVSDDGLL
jgi:uncharacterized membrane protein YcjF (UPF0283 family)